VVPVTNSNWNCNETKVLFILAAATRGRKYGRTEAMVQLEINISDGFFLKTPSIVLLKVAVNDPNNYYVGTGF